MRGPGFRVTVALMRSLRHPLALWVLRAVLAAWLGVLGAAEYHRAAVVHETCEHGLVVESQEGETVAEPRSDGPIAKATPAEPPHDHGCLMPAGDTSPTAGIGAVTAPAWSATPPRAVAAHVVAAPRPPPLDYAPKTSPPAAG